MDRPATVSAHNCHSLANPTGLNNSFPIAIPPILIAIASGFRIAERRYTTRNPFSLPTLLSALGYGLAWITPMVASTKRI
ncbi:hypothetical protein KC222_00910 [Cedecea davisae]|uniref:Uncharacterized protein n=1 Tax=Cedecea davisae TaxID=158484 RepID=A0ABS6DBI2_9ENTR|nr:hypothetical protein [Cedecea davisae]MBU4680573.1 hypothetical protein [Cedecea davisae]MBU4685763.1 hypothetical protein [Cedecea davisae]